MGLSLGTPPVWAHEMDFSGNSLPGGGYEITDVLDIDKRLFLDPVNGNDVNSGLVPDQPKRTFTAALSVVGTGGSRQDGWTIILKAGQYRTTPFGTMDLGHFAIQSYEDQEAWFNGCDIVSPASFAPNAMGNGWQISWSTPEFCDGRYYLRNLYNGQYETDAATGGRANGGPCTWRDNAKGVTAPDPQMVFIDDVHQPQVANETDLAPGNFFYDWTNRRLVIGTNPTGKVIEVTRRPNMIFGGNDPDRDKMFRGVGFHRFASNECSSSIGANTRGALLLGNLNEMYIECCAFNWNAGWGFAASKPEVVGHFQSCIVAYNGAGGTSIAGGSAALNDIFYDSCVIRVNNRDGYGGQCSSACQQAGSHQASLIGGTYTRCIIEDNNGMGWWCDEDCRDVIVSHNLIRRNGGRGIIYEVSSNGRIVSNVVEDNNQSQINVIGPDNKVWNNTMLYTTSRTTANVVTGFNVYDDSRTDTSVGYPADTRRTEFVNNVTYAKANGNPMSLHERPASGNLLPEAYYSRFENNSFRRHAATLNCYRWQLVTHRDPANLQAAESWGFGDEVVTGGDPFFVNFDVADYRIRVGSTTHAGAENASPLTAEIAEAIDDALGFHEGDDVGRGAFTWPGSGEPLEAPPPTTDWVYVNPAGNYIGVTLAAIVKRDGTYEVGPFAIEQVYTGWSEVVLPDCPHVDFDIDNTDDLDWIEGGTPFNVDISNPEDIDEIEGGLPIAYRRVMEQ